LRVLLFIQSDTLEDHTKSILERWTEAILDLVFPTRCAGCGKVGILWCWECDQRLEPILPPICGHCGSPLGTQHICQICTYRKPSLEIRSYGRYAGPLMRAILQLKYRPDRRLARLMANWLSSLEWSAIQKNNLVLPVPLGLHKHRERGYNQASLIAEPFAHLINKFYADRILERHRETRSQVGLDVEDRWENVRDAFCVQVDRTRGQRVILIDDLCTTGATLSACADALYQAGAASVIGLTVGRA
jgi:ComF family protein